MQLQPQSIRPARRRHETPRVRGNARRGNPVGHPERLAALRRTGLLDTLPEASFDRVTRLVARLLDVPVALVSLVDADRQFFKSCVGLDGTRATERETPLSHSFCQYVVIREEALFVEDAREHPLVRDNPAVAEYGVLAYAGFPLTNGGEVIGTLCAVDTRPRHWTEEEIGLLEDLAALAQTEIDLRLDVAERRQAEGALRTLVAGSPLGIMACDARGAVSVWNPAMERLLGWSAGAVVGGPPPHVPPETRGEWTALQERVLRGETVTGARWEHRDRGGRAVQVSLSLAPLHDADGGVRGMIVLMEDVCERVRVERMKDEFVSVVSHELRTPLTSIRGSLGLLASGRLGTLSAQGRRMMDIAAQNTDRLVRLVNDILDLERLDAGRVRMQPCTVEADALVQQAIDALHGVAERAEVRLDNGAASLCVHADPDRVVQVLTNLLGNAIKFSPPGSVVRASAEQSGSRVVFRVEDRGRGIPPELLESIFERFQQVDSSDARQKGGSGLGLAIARSIVQQHGGRIWAQSVPGEGSTFRFTLPSAPRTAGGEGEDEVRRQAN